MANNADPTSGNVGSASASGMASDSNVDIERMINDAVSKALGARMKRLNVEEQINAAVQKALASTIPATAQAETAEAPSHGETEQRTNLKTLNSQLKAMQERIDAAERKAKEADDRAAQARLRSDLQAAFAKHAGADNPHLPAYLNHYAGQFRVQDGNTYQLRKDDFGNDELVPLDLAAEQLFKSELKHLIPKAQPNLPPASIVRGQPMAQSNGQQGQPRGGFLEQEIMHAQAMTDPTVFNEIYGAKKPQ